jgi:ribonucleoside-diphosphate reductase alpha chain
MSKDTAKGIIKFKRRFSTNGQDPFDSVKWVKRDIEITEDSGKAVFSQKDVEVPETWSITACRVAVSKYFYGIIGTPGRETSIKSLIHRVAHTIAKEAVLGAYVEENSFVAFYDEMRWLLLHQYFAFNSPVWFNVGLYSVLGVRKPGTKNNWIVPAMRNEAELSKDQYAYPQCSACFIQRVNDDMESIMQLATNEAMLFKFGSGTGTNLSTLRSAREVLSGGGKPSGPLSFLRIYDQVANVVKSGGKTRRAAKMDILNDNHGDIEEFIDVKPNEEKKAWALIEQGYDGSFGGEAYNSVMFQNENLSVRLSDEFMRKAISTGDSKYWTRSVTTGEPLEEKDAKVLLRKISEGAWLCGDPGVQFDGIINRWNTCRQTDRINATNPCSEFIFLDDTACNLASINLVKFYKGTEFDLADFDYVVRMVILCQEILVDMASYPTKTIAENSVKFRPLGLGYANLGSLLMRMGLPYDSEEGREIAAAITSLMTGLAYYQSSLIASFKGAFNAGKNAVGMGEVLKLHEDSAKNLRISNLLPELSQQAKSVWTSVLEFHEHYGVRNAQVTVLAPTGTIGFMMDVDTTGIEPDLSLVKYKNLAGGGTMKIVNQSVMPALIHLGYGDKAAKAITAYIEDCGCAEGCADLKEVHLPVFDCALTPAKGKRSIDYRAHLKMMAAVQPFLSGGISKTVNMPNSATVDDIQNVYISAWIMGLKCVAVYRDGSKKAQPLNVKKNDKAIEVPMVLPVRKRLPDTRRAITHKFSIAEHEGYITVGFFEDGSIGELFLQMSKEGSTIGGLMDTVGTLTSIALQYGVPLSALVNKFSNQRFEPSGFSKHPQIKMASSVIDYVFRWMDIAAKNAKDANLVGAFPKAKSNDPEPAAGPAKITNLDAPMCPNCGHVTVRNGACHKCPNCGESLGCS